MVQGFIKGQGLRDYDLTCYWLYMGYGYLVFGILYRESNLGEREKQRQPINDKSCEIYQDVYEYVEKILKKCYFY